MTKLIVGLGNPETRYQNTRHNAGWLFITYLASAWRLPSPRSESRFYANLSRGQVDGQEVILTQPTTYMNNSGRAVAAICNFYKLNPTDELLLVYDDLDLELGRYKLTTHPPRTHNGVADVKRQLGTDRFTHLRLGVDDRAGDRQIPPMDYVLMTLPAAALDTLNSRVFSSAIKEVRSWL